MADKGFTINQCDTDLAELPLRIAVINERRQKECAIRHIGQIQDHVPCAVDLAQILAGLRAHGTQNKGEVTALGDLCEAGFAGSERIQLSPQNAPCHRCHEVRNALQQMACRVAPGRRQELGGVQDRLGPIAQLRAQRLQQAAIGVRIGNTHKQQVVLGHPSKHVLACADEMEYQFNIGFFKQTFQRRVGLDAALSCQHQQAKADGLNAGRNGIGLLHRQRLFLELQTEFLLIQALRRDGEVHQQHGIALILCQSLQHLRSRTAQVFSGNAGAQKGRKTQILKATVLAQYRIKIVHRVPRSFLQWQAPPMEACTEALSGSPGTAKAPLAQQIPPFCVLWWALRERQALFARVVFGYAPVIVQTDAVFLAANVQKRPRNDHEHRTDNEDLDEGFHFCGYRSLKNCPARQHPATCQTRKNPATISIAGFSALTGVLWWVLRDSNSRPTD